MRSPLSTGRGRAVGKPRSRLFMMLLGLGGLGFAIVLLWIGFNAANSIPGRSYYNLKAEFDEADNLSKTFQVRIGAKLVGQVSSVEARDGKAIVGLQLSAAEKPLRSDTTIEVRPRSPIGVRYVDIRPGTKGRPLPEGATIPNSQTSSTIPLDGALEAFDPATRPKAQKMFRELGAGFAGRGEDGNQTLAMAPEFLQDADLVVEAFTELDGAMARFIRHSQGAANAADPVRVQIAEGFDPEARSLRPFSQAADSVRGTLEEAPPTLRTLDVRLPSVNPLLREVGAFSRTSVPTLRIAPAALRETSAMMRESHYSLRHLDRTLQLAQESVDPTLDLLDTLDPVLPDLREVMRHSVPILDALSLHRCDVDRFFRNWESMFAFDDGKTGMLRYNVLASLESLEGGNAGTDFRDDPYPSPCAANDTPADSADSVIGPDVPPLPVP